MEACLMHVYDDIYYIVQNMFRWNDSMLSTQHKGLDKVSLESLVLGMPMDLCITWVVSLPVS